MRRRNTRARFAALVALAFLVTAVFSVGATTAVASPHDPTLGVTALQARLDASGGSMSGYLKTVVKGANIVNIPVTVLAVTSGFGSGPADMSSLILFKATGPEIDSIGGIASGMSGSPIYVNDAGVYKLVGALSYGDIFTIGGVGLATPIEAMTRIESSYSPASLPRQLSSPVVVDGQVKDRVMIAPSGSDAVSAPANTIVAKPLSAVFIGGLDPKSSMYKAYSKKLQSKGIDVVPLQGGLSSKVANYNAPFQPGSGVAVLAARGDLWVGGVGTVTYTDANRVLAFGHPAFWDGSTGLYLCNAWIDGIWPSTISPYKLGRPAAVRGTLTQDRFAGIMGVDGPKPEDVPVTATATNQATGEVEHTTVQLPRIVADSASGMYFGLPGAAAYVAGSRVLDSMIVAGTAVTTTTVVVSDDTTTYTLVRRNIQSTGFDALYYSVSDVDEMVTSLQAANMNGIAHARIRSVDLESSFSPVRREAEIVDATVAEGLRYGDNTVTVSFHAFGNTATQTLDVPLYIPSDVPLTGELNVIAVNAPGGGSSEMQYAEDVRVSGSSIDRRTVKDVVDELNAEVDNTVISVAFQPSLGGSDGGSEPAATGGYPAIETTRSTDWMVSGRVTKSAPQLDLSLRTSSPVRYGQSPLILAMVTGGSGDGLVSVTGAGSTEIFELTEGSAFLSTPPLHEKTTLVVTLLGDDFTLPTQATIVIGVRAKTTLKASKTTLDRGKKVTLTAKVLPSTTGGRVAFQRLRGSKWVTLKSVAVSSGGTASYAYSPSKSGKIKVRARFTGSSRNASSNSPSITLRVK